MYPWFLSSTWLSHSKTGSATEQTSLYVAWLVFGGLGEKGVNDEQDGNGDAQVVSDNYHLTHSCYH